MDMPSRESKQAKDERFDMVDITQEVQKAVEEKSIEEGICLVYTTSVTASILVTSTDNPAGHEDILEDLDRVFPDRGTFRFSGPALKGAAHAKSAVAGTSRDFIVKNGILDLAPSEGIFLTRFYKDEEAQYKV